MFGIGGGELIVIILIVLMLFGSDKIPEIARGLGKGMQQLKDATNEIKSEIHKSADVDGLKNSINELGVGTDTMTRDINDEVNKVKEDLENMSGPIKRIR